jgi:CRP-like cAMP-binding protein
MKTSVSTVPSDPRQNRLLAARPDGDYERLLPSLELVSLPLGQVVYEAGGSQPYMYFPADCIVSLLYVMEDGASAEIAVTGHEGLVGISPFMGGETTPGWAVVQSAGTGYRLRAAVCNRHHSVEQQLCRWLLLSLDRLPSNELTMTQELIANMLGVRREGVTEAAGRLQAAGLIKYSRGHIEVLDRARLERRVCECYAVVKREYDRLREKKPMPAPVNPAVLQEWD